MAVPVGRISQGAAVFCVRNASTSRVVRSMPSRSTSRHFFDATSCRRRCSTTISTGAGSSRRRRSGAAHATAPQTSCTHGCVDTCRRWCPSRWSRRLVAVPDSSCLQRSSPGRCFPRRRSSLVRVVWTSRRLDLRLGRRDADGGRTRNCWAHSALRLGLLPQFRCRRWSCRSDGAYVITRLLLTQDRRAYSSKMPSRHFNKWAIEQGPKARPSKPR